MNSLTQAKPAAPAAPNMVTVFLFAVISSVGLHDVARSGARWTMMLNFALRAARHLGPLAVIAALFGCVTPAPAPAPPSGEAMAATADSRATDAALEIMRRGGNAVDAAIAAEFVLGLVEPQSSGIGGGAFLIFYDATSEAITGFDGRERAPAGATPGMFLDAAGEPLDFFDAQVSGLSIGTPLLVAMLKHAHDKHGLLPWADLATPAIRIAEDGFALSPMVADALKRGPDECACARIPPPVPTCSTRRAIHGRPATSSATRPTQRRCVPSPRRARAR